MKRFRAIVGLVCFILSLSAVILPAAMQTSRARGEFSQKVTELMIMAQKARDAGDMANAELFWMHARELRPSLPRPAWLDRKPVFRPDPPPVSEDELLRRIASLSYEQAKILLEERLKLNPSDEKARRLYFDMAQANKDHIQVKRHESILPSGKERGWVYYFFAVLLLVLLIWQLTKLYQDLKDLKYP